jgi:hypothetical protein
LSSSALVSKRSSAAVAFIDILLDPFPTFFSEYNWPGQHLPEGGIPYRARVLLCTKLRLFCGQPDKFSAK